MTLPLNQIICGDALEVMKEWPERHSNSTCSRRERIMAKDSGRYFDDHGTEVIVYQGLNGQWGTFRKGVYAHHRIKSPALPMVQDRHEAERNLEEYAKRKRGWTRIPSTDETRIRMEDVT